MAPPTLIDRARASAGASSHVLYRLVASVIQKRHPFGGTLLDVGCGCGALWGFVRGQVQTYLGVDAVRYDGLPDACTFHQADLETTPVPLPDEIADVVVAIETIEHLENPRAFVRELTRLTKWGGLIVLTTPNQLSLLSKMTFLLRSQFNAFQEAPGLYPAHRTALLEIDLLRLARECRLQEVQIRYTNHGRIPGTRRHWPAWLGLRGRAFSDNVLASAKKRHRSSIRNGGIE
jgi:2-polyprenyl-3-methyl-5-hydroxy-6-metoxy-1,4-benzoquinol methylase